MRGNIFHLCERLAFGAAGGGQALGAVVVGARHLCWEIRTPEQTAAICQSAVHVQAVLTRKVVAIGGESYCHLTSKSARPRLATQLAPQQVKPLLQALSAATPLLGLQPYTPALTSSLMWGPSYGLRSNILPYQPENSCSGHVIALSCRFKGCRCLG